MTYSFNPYTFYLILLLHILLTLKVVAIALEQKDARASDSMKRAWVISNKVRFLCLAIQFCCGVFG